MTENHVDDKAIKRFVESYLERSYTSETRTVPGPYSFSYKAQSESKALYRLEQNRLNLFLQIAKGQRENFVKTVGADKAWDLKREVDSSDVIFSVALGSDARLLFRQLNHHRIEIIKFRWQGSKGPSEFLERYGSKIEVVDSAASSELLERSGHEGQAKWVALPGRVDPRRLGRNQNYTHKMIIELEPGTIDWMMQRQMESKPDVEPDRFEIPSALLPLFNRHIRSITLQTRMPQSEPASEAMSDVL